MILSVIRELALQFSKAELENAAQLFEQTQRNVLKVQGKDDGDVLTNLLMAITVRSKLDRGQTLSEALKEHSQSVQNIVAGASKNAGSTPKFNFQKSKN